MSLGAAGLKVAPVSRPCCHVLAHMPAMDGMYPSPGCPEMAPAASCGGVPACDAPAVRRGSPATHLPPRGLISARLRWCGSVPLCGVCSQDPTVREISSPPLILSVGSWGADNDEGV